MEKGDFYKKELTDEIFKDLINLSHKHKITKQELLQICNNILINDRTVAKKTKAVAKKTRVDKRIMNKLQGKPINHGTKWTDQQIKHLSELISENKNMNEMCCILERSEAGIISKIASLVFTIEYEYTEIIDQYQLKLTENQEELFKHYYNKLKNSSSNYTKTTTEEDVTNKDATEDVTNENVTTEDVTNEDIN